MKTTTRTNKVIDVAAPGAISKKIAAKENPKAVRRSTRGLKKTSDYINFEKALLKGKELLWTDKDMIIGFYIIFSINCGLRVSDVTRLKYSDLEGLKLYDILTLTEQKTGKVREIEINDYIYNSFLEIQTRLSKQGKYKSNDYIFKSQKNTVYATVSLNRKLKTIFAGYARNISTHSLRKSFGRQYYDTHNQSEYALMVLSDLFQHSNMAITRRYLGLRREEINHVYRSLVTVPW